MEFPTEIRPCKWGRGVFATRDIKKGENLCIYDGVWLDGNPNECEYSLNWQGVIIDGFKEVKTPGGWAQLCNDGYAFILAETDKMPQVLKDIAIYMKKSTELNNVSLKSIGKTVYFCAERDIKKDEEIYFSYGFRYWMGKKKVAKEEQVKINAAYTFVIDYFKQIAGEIHDKLDAKNRTYFISEYIINIDFDAINVILSKQYKS